MPNKAGRLAQLTALVTKYAGAGLLDGASDEFGPATPDATDHGDKPEQFAADLEALGPTFIKLGQILSTRQDLLPADYTAALERLQDDVAPVPFEEIRSTVELELRAPLKDLFRSFDEEPLAAASLAQVHRAITRNGRDVVVKVLRPGIRDVVRDDMELLSTVAEQLDARTAVGTRVGASGLLAQFRRSVADELDYRKEAANLVRFGELVRDHEHLTVPAHLPDYSTDSVLVIERVEGRKVTDITALGLLDIDGRELVSELFSFMLRTMLQEGILHADPHPGNLLLTPDGRLAIIDIGMVASISRRVRTQLVKLLLALGEGDGGEAAVVLADMGTKLEDFDAAGFNDAVSHLVSSTTAIKEDLQAGTVLMRLAQVSGQHGLRPPDEMSLVGKALLNLDRAAQHLDPHFEPVAAIRRELPAILQAGLVPGPGQLAVGAIDMKEFVEKLPGQANRVMDALAQGQLAFRVHAFDEDRLMAALQRVANRVTMGIVLAAITIAAALMMRFDAGPTVFGYPALATIFFLLAAIGGLALVASIVWGDRHVARRAKRTEAQRRTDPGAP